MQTQTLARSRPLPREKTAGPEESANAGDSSDWEDVDSDDNSDEQPPYEYYCRPRPFFDVGNENDEKDEDEQLDEEDLEG